MRSTKGERESYEQQLGLEEDEWVPGEFAFSQGASDWLMF